MRLKITFILLFFCAYNFAQNSINKSAAEILDETAHVFKNDMDIKASFKSEQIFNKKTESSTTGEIMLKDKKLKIITPELIIWYDGKTQWTYLKQNQEVNISNPSKEELFFINPYMFLDDYKKEYNSSVVETTLRGHRCYEVTLIANNSHHKIKEILLSINKQTKQLECIRLRHENDCWLRISITNYNKKNHFSKKDFSFNSKEFSNVELIDLR